VIVADASAVIEVLLNTSRSRDVAERLLDPAETLHAPHLLDVEVAHVLRRYLASGELDARRGEEALLDFLALPLARYSHDLLLPRAWELRHALTAYDAMYVVLAEALGADLVTCDARLGRSRGHRARIVVL
jgi:predicted nucleic acid-binding protein